ncbi:MAG: ATP-binding protein [Bacteroides sp.]|nr:ATP-binding protein [Bacteroides sp.]
MTTDNTTSIPKDISDFYRPRIADRLLSEKLEAKGAVLIRGPKWCGKTTTGERFANSIIYVDQPSLRSHIQQLSKLDPSLLLDGPTPRLIDEWQLAPALWDAVRFEVDHRRKRGQFILTGSAVPIDRNKEDIRHTGAGRFAIIEMLPMSLLESGESTGSVSLSELFDGNLKIKGESTHTLSDMAFLTCRGGWPFAIAESLNEKAALSQARDYLDIVTEEDISRVDGVERNVERARLILRSYARFQGTQTPISKIRQDIAVNDNDSITDDTIASYLNALRQIYVVKDLEAWNPNIKSKAAIRTTPTRYFTDPSIATAALRVGPKDLINDLKAFGLIFETLCVRDLRVYASAIDGDVYHYRDSNGLECDVVMHLRNGKYGLIEIKLGGERLIEEGAGNLQKLKTLLDTQKMGEPSFMMILTAVGPYAYRREDGICIVPIGCLKD